jgi:phenylacetic acid degradation operon negative regulatory protein
MADNGHSRDLLGLRDRGDSGHRPQALLFSFFGGVALKGDFPPVPTTVLLSLLGDLKVAEPAARATLARMTRKGLLASARVGRTTRYTLTPAGRAVVEEGARRVEAESPFAHPAGEWTLLSYSLPESRRDVRHQLRAALAWAGFGPLRDGLWIAPGVVDVEAVFSKAELEDAAESADWFSASPMTGVDVQRLIRRAWPVDEIRAQHDRFIARWATRNVDANSLSLVTLLGADWLQLLRVDPGLPASDLEKDWPADRSAQIYRRRYRELLPDARAQLKAAVADA